ncbi:hypothetical protein HID58_003744, partial [Brassica napus]
VVTLNENFSTEDSANKPKSKRWLEPCRVSAVLKEVRHRGWRRTKGLMGPGNSRGPDAKDSSEIVETISNRRVKSITTMWGVVVVACCDPFLGAAIVYGGSQTSCYQNPLVGFFNVDFDFFAFFRMQALGLQVKLLYGSLLSLATSILRYVLIVSVYLFTVEDHSGCNRLSPWGV